MKTKLKRGFTLIELLVVITIIAILASIAVPVYNGITVRAEQTKALSNAKQIALGCKIFAIDNDGIFPDTGNAMNPIGDTLSMAYGTVPGDTSTGNFGALIGGGYLPSETIFFISKERNGAARLTKPDDDITMTPLTNANNAWAYTAGLDDGVNPSVPIVYTRGGAMANAWPKGDTGAEGGVWSDKIIYVSVDYAGTVYPLDPTVTGGTGVTAPALKVVAGQNIQPFDTTTGWPTAGSYVICEP